VHFVLCVSGDRRVNGVHYWCDRKLDVIGV
jgi:hypothetical protein